MGQSLKPSKPSRDATDIDVAFDEMWLECLFCHVEVNKLGIVITGTDRIRKGKMIVDHVRCSKRDDAPYHCLVPDNPCMLCLYFLSDQAGICLWIHQKHMHPLIPFARWGKFVMTIKKRWEKINQFIKKIEIGKINLEEVGKDISKDAW